MGRASHKADGLRLIAEARPFLPVTVNGLRTGEFATRKIPARRPKKMIPFAGRLRVNK
jgi:hypothetical protein